MVSPTTIEVSIGDRVILGLSTGIDGGFPASTGQADKATLTGPMMVACQ